MQFFNNLIYTNNKPRTPTANHKKNLSFSNVSESSKINPFKPKNKEIVVNRMEEENVKIYGDYKKFKFDFKVFGRSIFQNLILTANAYALHKEENEAIPVKCNWRRVKRETVIAIKDINSNSYIPTAEDIGYIIEVEATPIDTNIYGKESAFAQYGPITLDSDIKSTIELLLASGGTKFSCYVYDIQEQEKVNNKEILLHVNAAEFKLCETDYTGKEKLLEVTRYHHTNPQIKLHPYDSFRFSLKFYDIENEEANENIGIKNLIKQKLKSEYHLIAMSKQCRELIYLLMQYFLIDEKIKNGKLFTVSNYNILPEETKTGVTDLIAEIKTLREENNILLNNLKILEKSNRNLKEEMRNLEEDFQITLESINCTTGIAEEIDKNMKQNNKLNTGVPQSNNYSELKKKCEELRDLNSNLTAKERALREENKQLIHEIEIHKNTCNELNAENKKCKLMIVELEQEINGIKKSYSMLNETKNKIQKSLETQEEEIKKLVSERENKSTGSDISKNGDILNELKSKLSELQKANENLVYENKNLVVQRNLLSNQKEVISKEFEKIKKEKISAEEKHINLKDDIENLNIIIKEKESTHLSINDAIQNTKKENSELIKKYELLEIEYNAMKENFNKILFSSNNVNDSNITDVTHVKILPEEFEEYDQLKRDKDECDAIIMQLRSNNEAKELEIKNLKKVIEKLKNNNKL